MCGIAGFIRISGIQSKREFLLSAMHNRIAHRGPDGYGIWQSADGSVNLTHRRLSIIDTSSAGAQPMFDTNQTVVITFNGEIYNHLALRAELEHRGYLYHSKTDTETILYAYKEWGIACLEKLEGMFAFALYDVQKDELYLVRDRIGIKPLYFSLQNNHYSFASEIKALWPLPWIEKKINYTALYHYLTLLVTPAPLTLYQGIYKLPAGFYIKIAADRSITATQWYHLKAMQLTANTEEQYQEQLDTLLQHAVHKRLMADVPLGVFLSGGIDSSLITALMARETGLVKTFNVAFKNDAHNDERRWAQRVARHCATQHHEIEIDEQDAFNFFEKMVNHQDEPLGDPVCIPLYFVAKLLKDSGVTVALVGEGADELWCGYPSYLPYLRITPFFAATQHLPKNIRSTLARGLHPWLKHKQYHADLVNRWSHNHHPFYTSALAFPEIIKKDLWCAVHQNEADPIVQMFFAGMHHDTDSYALLDFFYRELTQQIPTADTVNRMAYMELKHRLPELLLMRVDKMTMATSVEARVPFLDHTLVEFALGVPQKYKYRHGQTKYLLKKVGERYLPHDILYRKKVGFGAPTTRWLSTGRYFKPYFADQLAGKRPLLQEFIDMSKLDEIYLKAPHDPRCAPQIWALQNLIAFL